MVTNGREPTIELFELAAADENQLFSPYVWTIRLALFHKQLPFKSIPWRLVEKDVIAFSGQGAVRICASFAVWLQASWLLC